jgi:hypothetical protein
VKLGTVSIIEEILVDSIAVEVISQAILIVANFDRIVAGVSVPDRHP